MNIFLILFSLLGIVTFLAIAYYFVRRFMDEKHEESMKKMRWPPDDYMRDVGSKCPDYWSYQPLDENSHQCLNTFNLPEHDPNNKICGGDRKTFTTIKKWPPNSDDPGLKEACDWLKNCGPRSNIPASWMGMDQYCG